MADIDATIEGMHCSGCEKRVSERLSRIEGVRSVEADHEAGRARVTFVAGQEDADAVAAAVDELGYDLVEVERG